MGFPGFPVATSGSYQRLFDMADSAVYSGNLLSNSGGTDAGAFAALIARMNAGHAYVNIHNQIFPGGEICGFLSAVPPSVPEPATNGLMLVGRATIGWLARRRRTG